MTIDHADDYAILIDVKDTYAPGIYPVCSDDGRTSRLFPSTDAAAAYAEEARFDDAKWLNGFEIVAGSDPRVIRP